MDDKERRADVEQILRTTLRLASDSHGRPLQPVSVCASHGPSDWVVESRDNSGHMCCNHHKVGAVMARRLLNFPSSCKINWYCGTFSNAQTLDSISDSADSSYVWLPCVLEVCPHGVSVETSGYTLTRPITSGQLECPWMSCTVCTQTRRYRKAVINLWCCSL